MNLSKFVGELTNLKVEKRIDFNSISETEYNDFISEFDELNLGDKEFYLLKIIEEVNEDSLLEGNFKKWFSDESIIEVLQNSL